ncbi:MAG: CBS domain-containing protein [Serpentinimonas sp.]|jgi:CBS domain-containing protein|nr:CBS domain-containing protein [Serpentinimonas sp.]
MKVKEVMSIGVVSASTTESARSVVAKMLTRRCGAIPVADEGGRLLGIVTLRDVMLPMYPNYAEYVHDPAKSRDFLEIEKNYSLVLGKTVAEIMYPKPMFVTPETPVMEAASYMGLKNLRRMPVVEDGRLVGMVSIGDINRGLFFARSG